MQTQTANGKQLATHFSAMKLLAETLYLLLLCRFSHVRLCATPLMAAHEAPPSWDSPDKNTGVGCHFLLQCMKVKSESEVAQLCPTLSDPMDYSLPGSSVHGIFQARVLEWGAITFSALTCRPLYLPLLISLSVPGILTLHFFLCSHVLKLEPCPHFHLVYKFTSILP